MSSFIWPPQASGGGGGSGTVTSVGVADTSTTPIFSVSGSPVTAAGTIDLTLSTQSPNLVFAGPTNGLAAQPGFRSLVNADIPATLSLTSLTVTNPITGSVTGSAGSVAAANITGTTLPSNVVSSSLTSVGTLANLTVTNPISGSVTGSAGSVAAANITGTTLASNVVTSSLTTVGTLGSLTVTGTTTGAAFASSTASAASAGQVRLANTDTVKWRSAGNTADLAVGVSASNRLQFAAVDLVDLSTAQTLTNKTISGASNTLSSIGDSSLSTSYVKADGTRALTANWNAGAFSITANSVAVGSSANTITSAYTVDTATTQALALKTNGTTGISISSGQQLSLGVTGNTNTHLLFGGSLRCSAGASTSFALGMGDDTSTMCLTGSTGSGSGGEIRLFGGTAGAPNDIRFYQNNALVGAVQSGVWTIGQAATTKIHSFNGSTSGVATAGTNGSTPTQVAGYIVFSINGTNQKIPYYNV